MRAQGLSLDVFDNRDAVSGQAQSEAETSTPAGQPRRVRLVLGAGVANAPAFQGSDRNRWHLLPVLQVRYGPFFAGLGGIGAHFYQDSKWRLTASLVPGRGRKESDDAHLQGLGDVDSTVKGALTARYASGWFIARADVAADLAGQGQGTLARFDLYGRLRVSERSNLFAGPGFTWANRQHEQTFFGVTSTQSANSGLPQYEAGSGVDSLRFSAGALYRFDRNWVGLAAFTASRLKGDAAGSPIVESRTQNVFFATVAYVF